MSNFGFISKKRIAREIAEIIHAHPDVNDFDSGACSALNSLSIHLDIKPMHRNKLGGGTGEMLSDMRGENNEQKETEIKVHFKDGNCDVIPQKFWDDYEYNYGLFVVKKKGEWIAAYNMECVACVEVG